MLDPTTTLHELIKMEKAISNGENPFARTRYSKDGLPKPPDYLSMIQVNESIPSPAEIFIKVASYLHKNGWIDKVSDELISDYAINAHFYEVIQYGISKGKLVHENELYDKPTCADDINNTMSLKSESWEKIQNAVYYYFERRVDEAMV